MRRHDLTLAGAILALLGIVSVCATQSVAADDGFFNNRPWCILAEEGKLVIIRGESDPECRSLCDCRWQCLVCDPQSLTPVSSFPLCTVGGPLGCGQTIRALRLSAGRLAIVADHEGGGGGFLSYVTIEDSGLGTEATSTTVSDSVGDVLYDKEGRAPLIDLRNLSLIEHRGQVYVVGQGQPENAGTGRARVTWIAPAPAEISERAITGRIIAKGENPRVVAWDRRYVVAVQMWPPRAATVWGKPIALYESTDLKEWRPMASPDAALEFYDYELTVANGRLTLVGIVDTSDPEKRGRPGPDGYRPPLAMVALAYDADKGAWETTTTRPDTTLTPQSEVKLIPPNATRGELKLLHREADGRFTAVSISE